MKKRGGGFLLSGVGLWSLECSPRGPGPHLVLGCFISTWSYSPKGSLLILMGIHSHGSHMARSHGRVGRGAARRGVLRGAFLVDSCLRMSLKVPPCGASGLQRAKTFGSLHPMSLGSQWLSPKIEGRALELDMCVMGSQTRVRSRGAHLNKEPGKWYTTSRQRHSDFAPRFIAPLGHK